jgi:hypothetical protein
MECSLYMLPSNDFYKRPPELQAVAGIRFFLAMYAVLFHFTLAILVNAPYFLQRFMAAG